VIDTQIVPTFGPAKTLAFNRTISLPSSVADVLAAHLSQFGEGEGQPTVLPDVGWCTRRVCTIGDLASR
jgi:hypothetical protein